MVAVPHVISLSSWLFPSFGAYIPFPSSSFHCSYILLLSWFILFHTTHTFDHPHAHVIFTILHHALHERLGYCFLCYNFTSQCCRIFPHDTSSCLHECEWMNVIFDSAQIDVSRPHALGGHSSPMKQYNTLDISYSINKTLLRVVVFASAPTNQIMRWSSPSFPIQKFQEVVPMLLVGLSCVRSGVGRHSFCTPLFSPNQWIARTCTASWNPGAANIPARADHFLHNDSCNGTQI